MEECFFYLWFPLILDFLVIVAKIPVWHLVHFMASTGIKCPQSLHLVMPNFCNVGVVLYFLVLCVKFIIDKGDINF